MLGEHPQVASIGYLGVYAVFLFCLYEDVIKAAGFPTACMTSSKGFRKAYRVLLGVVSIPLN